VPQVNEQWKRLGELLVRRRIELDPAYRNRQTFVTARGLNYRTVSDIESGRRDNYGPQTIVALEVAYAVTPGAVRAALAGGDLEPLPGPAPRLAPVPGPLTAEHFADTLSDAEITEHIGWGSTADERESLAKFWALRRPRAVRLEIMRLWVTDDQAEDFGTARRGEAG
jgi:hypothetical protein